MGKPHKHAELIKAWADGKKIQYRTGLDETWKDLYGCEVGVPSFDVDYEYRIKPEPWSKPKSDVIESSQIGLDKNGYVVARNFRPHNIRFVFDGETGELKSAEVL